MLSSLDNEAARVQLAKRAQLPSSAEGYAEDEEVEGGVDAGVDAGAVLAGRIQQLTHLARSTYGESVVETWTKACATDGGDAFLHDYGQLLQGSVKLYAGIWEVRAPWMTAPPFHMHDKPSSNQPNKCRTIQIQRPHPLPSLSYAMRHTPSPVSVYSRMGTFPGGLEIGYLFGLHKAVVKVTLPEGQVATPPAILAILDELTRRRLFHVCSLLSHDALPRGFRQSAFDAIGAIATMPPDHEVLSVAGWLGVVAVACMDRLQAALSQAADANPDQDHVLEVARITPVLGADIEALVLDLLTESTVACADMGRCCWRRWRSLRLSAHVLVGCGARSNPATAKLHQLLDQLQVQAAGEFIFS